MSFYREGPRAYFRGRLWVMFFLLFLSFFIVIGIPLIAGYAEMADAEGMREKWCRDRGEMESRDFKYSRISGCYLKGDDGKFHLEGR